MNTQESQLHYPLADTLPAQGTTLEVAPGIRWIRMALPFALNHINLWLLRDEQDGRAGWTVVDCCISAPESRAQWEAIFESQLDGLPVLRVVATHMHPDHVGLAAWLCERWQCPLWMSSTDYLAARVASSTTNGFGGEAAALHFQSHGLIDADSLAKIRERAAYYPNLVPSMPTSYVRMQDGDTIRIGAQVWRCIAGYGHAPEHIALHCADARVLIAGDMVLPRISTNVSVFDMEPEGNPLALFLASLRAMQHLPADTLVLPSHGKPFLGLQVRLNQLHEHHAERLAETKAACYAEPLSAAALVPKMFKRELDLHQLTFAIGEALAHLHLLWLAGELTRSRGVDGVWRFKS
jgi:glyoxylase-like metal-dependent hydrolase (beta-lactamase superfamily II)